MDRAEYKATAKSQLKNHWGSLILLCVIYDFFFKGVNALTLNINSTPYPTVGEIDAFLQNPQAITVFFTTFFTALILTAIISVVAFPLLHGALTMGKSRYLVAFVEDGRTDLNILFGDFYKFKESYLLSFWYNLYLFLWSIIPFMGLIKTYSYKLTFYLKVAHPEYTAKQCITRSRELMNGRKWEFFVLDLSFMGWFILCIFTFFIGNLWLSPYIEVTYTNIIVDILRANGDVPAKVASVENKNEADDLNGIS